MERRGTFYRAAANTHLGKYTPRTVCFINYPAQRPGHAHAVLGWKFRAATKNSCLNDEIGWSRNFLLVDCEAATATRSTPKHLVTSHYHRALHPFLALEKTEGGHRAFEISSNRQGQRLQRCVLCVFGAHPSTTSCSRTISSICGTDMPSTPRSGFISVNKISNELGASSSEVGGSVSGSHPSRSNTPSR